MKLINRPQGPSLVPVEEEIPEGHQHQMEKCSMPKSASYNTEVCTEICWCGAERKVVIVQGSAVRGNWEAGA